MSQQHPAATDRYGPASFIAAVITIAIVQTVTWVWLPYWIANLFFFGLATVLVLPTALIMTQSGGKVAQAGRGMLIGYLATPLTIAITVIPITAVHLLLVQLA
jgi:hypothetical protein